MDVSKKRVLVVGMGKSGISATRLLHKKGALVTINDSKSKEELQNVVRELEGIYDHERLGKDPIECLEDIDMVVISPGVDFNQPWLKEAERKGIAIVSEIELGYWYCPCDIVAITGTNGKTTTTTLVGEFFKNAGYTTHVLGNIGVPMTSQVDKMKAGDICVCELSSFQILTSRQFSPKVFAFLNLTPDHLDKYNTMERYAESKAMMLDAMQEDSTAVLNYLAPLVNKYAARVKGNLLWFSNGEKVENGVYCKNGEMILSIDGVKTHIMEKKDVRMMGEHNIENALAAIATTVPYGIGHQVLQETLSTFSGVSHRMEIVDTIGGVTFINDSKGTNVDASIMAVRSMQQPTVLILGGYDKQTDFSPLFAAFTPCIKDVVVTGETAGQLKETAKAAGFAHVHDSKSFEDAVYQATMLAEDGYTVLLSPACASWDCFSDFEERGEMFKKVVERLK